MNTNQPLAFRMRPKTLDDYVGQEHVIGKDKLLYRTIKADRLSSLILWGPPGCGKTSLAKVISETTKYKFVRLNAVTSGVADIKKAIEEADNPLLNPSGKCILFIDEIHRFNKLQQDALLPFVENGTVILIGATTENPYFEVNKALISRSMVVKLEPLSKENIIKVIKRALTSKDGLGSYSIKIDDSTIEKIAEISNGDVRTALNGLEVAVLTTKMNSNR
jgi:putative ATPase